MTMNTNDNISYVVATMGLTNPWWTFLIPDLSLQGLVLILSAMWLGIQIANKLWEWYQKWKDEDEL